MPQPSRSSITAKATLLVALVGFHGVTSQSGTDFDVILATPPTQDDNQFQLQGSVSVLISAGNVFYDADNDCIPLQAFQITDQNGDPLGPFQMPTANYQDYVLDISSLNTGQGLKPYFRGVELVNASDRGWRLDYYKDGTSGNVYSTVMSGPVQQISSTEYLLTVDLMLRWSEEGDSLDRLGQGIYSHIALAIADFRSFTLTMAGPGSARMVANVFTTTTTPATTTEPPTTSAPTTAPPNIDGDTGSGNGGGLTTTTGEPDADGDRVNYPPPPSPPPGGVYNTGNEYYDNCMNYGTPKGPKKAKKGHGGVYSSYRTDDTAQYRGANAEPYECYAHGAHAKKGKKKKYDWDCSQGRTQGDYCEQWRTGCSIHYDAKGKKKTKCKKGKLGLGGLMSDRVQRATVVSAAAGAMVVMAVYAVAVRRQRQMSGYESFENNDVIEVSNKPVAPTALAAFGSFKAKDILLDAESFHLPPDTSAR